MKSDFSNQTYGLFYLSKIKGLGAHQICKLLHKYGQPDKVLALPAIKQLISKNKILDIKEEFINYQNCLNILDKEYPPLLKNIYDPPLFLFYQGNLKLLQSNYLLTMIGSRQLTDYHQIITKQLIKELTNTPLVLVSGLALGIDSLVHQQALANHLPTIAVLGSGLDRNVLYPKANKQLAGEIVNNNGLLLSEYPPETKPEIYHFPRRNRILAGLSKMTVVLSGAAKSGTLVTAQVALDEGREVYALPGNIDNKLCEGANNLINQGAGILTSADKIISTYNLTLK